MARFRVALSLVLTSQRAARRYATPHTRSARRARASLHHRCGAALARGVDVDAQRSLELGEARVRARTSGSNSRSVLRLGAAVARLCCGLTAPPLLPTRPHLPLRAALPSSCAAALHPPSSSSAL